MRKVVIFTMILMLVFAIAGCNDHSEPDEKAAESSSSNAVIDTTQAKKLPEKTENETVEKSTFTEETTQPPAAETGAEKVSKEPIFSQTTAANTEPKQDILADQVYGLRFGVPLKQERAFAVLCANFHTFCPSFLPIS